MKKAVMMFVLLAVAGAMAQKPKESVAVYMAGTEPVAVKGAYKVLGAELAKSLAKSGNYTAVDRTPEVIKVLSAADIFKQDGAIDVDKAKRAGKQLGVQMMCVAEITEVMKSYFLEARLVNVETAEISNVATAHGNMTAVEDVMRNAQAIATELIGGKVKLADFSFREIAANPDKAIREYTKAIRQEPDNAEYYFKRGYAYQCKGEFDIAIADYTDAIRLDPKMALYYSARGYLYGNNGKKDYDKAIADYSEAIRLDPNYSDAYNNRGVVYAMKGDNDRAIADYNEAIRLNPNLAGAYYNRGVEYYYKKDSDRAIADWNQAIRLNPDFAEAYNNRGVAYKNKGDHDRAISDYNQAIRLNPDYADAYDNRGVAYSDKSDYDRAISDYNEAIRLNSNSAMAYYHRGNAYVMKDDIDRAIADWNQTIRLNPDYAGAYSNRGIAYINKGDLDKAIADCNQAIRLNTNDADAYFNRGVAYAMKGDINRAIADWESVLRINPNNSGARQYLEQARRDAQSQRGQSAVQPQPVQQAATPSAPPPAPVSPPNPQLEQMIANYEKSLGQCAVSKSDRCADVIYILGGLYYEKAKATTARADYRKSTDMFWRLSREYPKYQKLPDAFNLMGAVYLSAGHSDTASIVFTQLLARFPKNQYVSAANLRLGEIAFAANDFGKAYEYFKKVKGMSGIDTPSREAFSYRLGMSAYHAGDYKNAIVHLNVYVSGCDTGVIKTKSFYDKASEYLRLARQKK